MKENLVKSGRLSLLKDLGTKRNKSGRMESFVLVKCDCGEVLEANKKTYNNGLKKYCSNDCKYKKLDKQKDIGKKFGCYTVLEYIETIKGVTYVYAICDCSKKKKVSLHGIKSSKPKNCMSCKKEKKFSVGSVLGKLKIISFLGEKVNCLCECGNEVSLNRKTIYAKPRKKSCGCSYKKDLTGQKIGMLTVISETEPILKIYNNKKIKKRRWICSCECGNENKAFFQSDLLDGKKSCGCLMSKENRSKRVRGENNPMYGKIKELHHNWDPQRSSELRKKERKLHENLKWRNNVYLRDNYKCKCCGKDSEGDIVAHHIFNYNDFPSLRFETSNGITLCQKCHKSFHAIFGKNKNDDKQLIIFANEYFKYEKYKNIDEIINNKEEVIFKEVLKPYVVKFSNGIKKSYSTYLEIKKELNISESTIMNILRNKKNYKNVFFDIYKNERKVKKISSIFELNSFISKHELTLCENYLIDKENQKKYELRSFEGTYKIEKAIN